MPGGDHLLRELIEFGAILRQRGFEFEPRFGQGAPAYPRIEEIAGFRQRGNRNARRQGQHAIFNLAVFGDQHDQRLFRLQPHEFDMLEPRIGFCGEHHRRRAGQARQPRQRFAKGCFNRLRLADRRKLGLDRLPLRLGEIAELHQRIDEKPQAQFGRQPPGRGMRRVDQAELLEVRHHVADRGRRQRHGDQARNVARADGFAGRQIALDDLAKDIPRTLVELGKPGIRRDQADRFVVGHWHSFTSLNLSISRIRYKRSDAVNPPVKTLPHAFRAPKSTASQAFLNIVGGYPMRPSLRAPDQLRAVSLERGVVKYAEGSCMVKFGDTHVLVTATLEERLPPWLKGQGRGWVTAEYGMLPRATLERTRREASAGKQNGRTVEIQRLIGRSLRATVDLEALGERQITVDCDVIQADGGTRTASITGAWVALADCIGWMKNRNMFKHSNTVLRDNVAAISCGIYNGTPVLDLDYAEDSEADTDANFVMTGDGRIIEVQGTAEKTPFSQDEFLALMALARKGVTRLVDLQKMAVA